MENIIIRKANISDAFKISEIYSYYVLNTSITFEYIPPTKEEFEKRISKTIEKYPYFVAEYNGEVVGYAYLSPFKERAAYIYSTETSIYVKQNLKAKGIGKALYDAIENTAKKQGILNLNACITYPNPSSIAFHEKCGYKKVAHFNKCGYKFDKWYDVIWMEKFLGNHEVPPNEFIPFSKLDI